MPVNEDDSLQALAKAKESILLMKKKMFRSHDLILQYGNKLKECERLKGDLCMAQEEAAKLKLENHANLTKVIKLETQSTSYEKKLLTLEQTIADKDVQIASVKSHAKQLECKLEAEQDKHEEYAVEEGLKRSTVEDKVKELVQELKTLKKSHAAEITKLERSHTSPQAKKGKKIIAVVKQTSEIGVNTDAEPPKPVKPALVNKSVLTDDFYHIKNNPYPLFCDKCEISIQPRIEKICGIMSHPPPISNMLSPIRDCEIQHRIHDDSNDHLYFDGQPHSNATRDESTRNKSTNEKINVNDTTNSLNRLIPPQVPQSMISNVAREIQTTDIQATSTDSTVPEVNDLRRRLATLEREIKKKSKRKTMDSSLTCANCCNHPHSMNHYGYPSTHANPLPNVIPNTQTEIMTEFMTKMIDLASKTDRHKKISKTDRRRKFNEQSFRDKKSKIKSRKRKKLEILRKRKNVGNAKWEIDNYECETETNRTRMDDDGNSTKPHLLRIDPNSVVDSCDTLFSPEETEKLSRTDDDTWEASVDECPTNSSNNIVRDNANRSSSTIDPIEPKTVRSQRPIRGRKRGRPSLFSNDSASDEESHSSKNKSHEQHAQIDVTEKSPIGRKIRSKRLQNKANERKKLLNTETCDKERQAIANTSQNSSIIDPRSISESDESVGHFESVISTRNLSTTDESHEKSVDDRNDVNAEMNSDSDDSDSTNLMKRTKQRKRKRLNSPKPTKRDARSNLMGRLRNLKKNTVANVSKTKNSPTIRATRSKDKLTKSLIDEDAKRRTIQMEKSSSVSTIEPIECLPVKKSRIAHVPKKLTNSRIDDEEPKKSAVSAKIERSEKIVKTAKTETTRDDQVGAAMTKKRLTRRSAVEKLAQLELENKEDSSKVKNCRTGMPPSVTNILRRVRTPLAKRDVVGDDQASTNLSNDAAGLVDAEKKLLDDDLGVEKAGDGSSVTIPLVADSKNEIGNSEHSPEKVRVDDDDSKGSKCLKLDVASKSDVTTEFDRPVDDSIVQSDRTEKSATRIISKTNDKKDGRVDEPKPTVLVEARSASIVTLLNPVDGISVKTSETSMPIAADVSSNSSTTVDDNKSNENIIRAKKSIMIDEMKASKDLGLKAAGDAISNDVPDDRIVVAIAKSEKNDKSNEYDKTISVNNEKSVEISSNVKSDDKTISVNNEKSVEISSNVKSDDKTISVNNEKSVEISSNVKSDDKTISVNNEKSVEISSNVKSDDKTISGNNEKSVEILSNVKSDDETISVNNEKSVEISSNVKSEDKTISGNNEKSVEISSNVKSDDKTISLNNEKSVEILTPASPMSPVARTILNDEEPEESTSQPITSQERPTIYDEIALSMSSNLPTSPAKNSIEKIVLHRDETCDMPDEKPIERNLITYDEDLHDESDDEIDEFDSKKIGSSKNLDETTNVVKKLRSRRVLSNPSTFVNHENSWYDRDETVVANDEEFDQPRSSGGVRSVENLLNRHIYEIKLKSAVTVTKLRKASAMKLQEAAENNVKVELNRLVESEEWTNELHESVIEKLVKVSSERTLAKSIVDFLIERASLDEPLDRTHTPPAPIMTSTQQRIVTLIHCLHGKRTESRLFDLVQAGIDYTIFKMGSPHSNETLEYLVRTFTVICRMLKDRERVRIFCYDAFYWLGRRALPIFTVVLRIWPEVLPKHGTVQSELPNCLVHVMNLEKLGNDPFPGIISGKKFITEYHKYPQNQASSDVVMAALIKSFHENYSNDIESAILLMSKRIGWKWALENVVEKGLMKVIRDDNYQWKYEALNLLGLILRNFPDFDAKDTVRKYIILLCQMLDSGEGSPDKQEGIVSAMLSLARFKPQFSMISKSILKWTYTGELRSVTLEHLDSFFRARPSICWRKQMASNK